MENENVEQTGSLLSAREYLSAILHEYQALRDGIKLRVHMRNGILIAFGGAVAVGIGKILLMEQPFEVNLFTKIILLGGLPLFWFLLLTFQVVLMKQIDRAAKVLSIIEHKVQLLFTSVGDQSLKKAIEQVEAKLQSDLTKSGAPNIPGLSNAIVWERLLRTRPHRSVTLRSRWWDSAWCRNIPCFLVAAILSSTGPVILAANELHDYMDSLWATKLIIVYFMIATLLTVLFSLSVFFGVADLHSLSFSFSVQNKGKQHLKNDSDEKQ